MENIKFNFSVLFTLLASSFVCCYFCLCFFCFYFLFFIFSFDRLSGRLMVFAGLSLIC